MATTAEKIENKAGYKKTELGWIPEEWEIKKIKEIVSKVGSGITPRGGSSTYKKEGIPFIRSQNVLYGRLSFDDIAFIDEKQHKSMSNSMVKPNDLLMNITGASIGRACIVPANVIESNVNQHVCIIRVNNSLVPGFLLHFLLSPKGQNQIDTFQAGGNREGLNYEQVRSFKIPFIPLTEQQKIAEILSCWDKVIEKTENLITAKTQLKNAFMQKLLTGKVRFEEFSGQKWKQSKIQDIFESKSVKHNGSDYLPILSVTKDGIKLQSEHFKKRVASKNTAGYLIVEKNEIAMSGLNFWMGSIDMQQIVPKGIISPAYEVFKIRNNNADKKFLKFFVRSHLMLKILVDSSVQGASIVRRNLNYKGFMASKLYIPSLEEQQKIAAVLNSCDKETELLNKQLDALKEQKKGLMQKLLTGQIRVKI
ncbi:MAG: restriction endonuclease subunit S [bacterium]